MVLRKFAEYDTTVVANGVEETNIKQSSNKTFDFNFGYPLKFYINGEEKLSTNVFVDSGFKIDTDPSMAPYEDKEEPEFTYKNRSRVKKFPQFIYHSEIYESGNFGSQFEINQPSNDFLSATKLYTTVDVEVELISNGAGCEFQVFRNGDYVNDGTFNEFNYEANLVGSHDQYTGRFTELISPLDVTDSNPATGTWEFTLSNYDSGPGDGTIESYFTINMNVYSYSFIEEVLVS